MLKLVLSGDLMRILDERGGEKASEFSEIPHSELRFIWVKDLFTLEINIKMDCPESVATLVEQDFNAMRLVNGRRDVRRLAVEVPERVNDEPV